MRRISMLVRRKTGVDGAGALSGGIVVGLVATRYDRYDVGGGRDGPVVVILQKNLTQRHLLLQPVQRQDVVHAARRVHHVTLERR